MIMIGVINPRCAGIVGVIFAVAFWATTEETPAEKTKVVSMATREKIFLDAAMATKGFTDQKVCNGYHCLSFLLSDPKQAFQPFSELHRLSDPSPPPSPHPSPSYLDADYL
jgi:hypothetical protein